MTTALDGQNVESVMRQCNTYLGFSSCLAPLKFRLAITALKEYDREGCVTQSRKSTEPWIRNLALTSASNDFTVSEIGMDE